MSLCSLLLAVLLFNGVHSIADLREDHQKNYRGRLRHHLPDLDGINNELYHRELPTGDESNMVLLHIPPRSSGISDGPCEAWISRLCDSFPLDRAYDPMFANLGGETTITIIDNFLV